MALIKHLLGEMSGKIGGAVFGHNRGGSFVRKWKKPTNPNSNAQMLVRRGVANLVAVWGELLTEANRESWINYAKNVAMKNRLGETIFLTGQNHFVRSNAPRLQNGLARVDSAPTVFNLGDFAPTSMTCVAVDVLSLAFDDTAVWADEDGSAMLLQQSLGKNPSIGFFKGPFISVAAMEGDNAAPPTTPAAVTLISNVADTQKVFLRARISRVDGRLSSAQTIAAIVAIP